MKNQLRTIRNGLSTKALWILGTMLFACNGSAKTNLDVYWVGHSLMSATDQRTANPQSLMELMGKFSRQRGVEYNWYKHTTPGAPISWNWIQEPDLRSELERNAKNYNTMVVTEGTWPEESLRWNSSDFFLRRFYCAILNENPDADVYLYESWQHLYAGDPDGKYPEPQVWDWRAQIDIDRPHWEAMIDGAVANKGIVPDGWKPEAFGVCNASKPIWLIPVGTALGALYDRIKAPKVDDNWEGKTIHDFFANPYVDWPSDWPLDAASAASVDGKAIVKSLKSKYGGDADDIHPSGFGIYFVTLVHYAVISRESPVGLPRANGVSKSLATALQKLVWEVVSKDPRTGINR